MAHKRLNTTQQGLGWRHQQRRKELLRLHADGALCEWCGEPMFRDRTRNPDYDPNGPAFSGSLHADHRDMTRAEAIRRGVPIPLPNRLLHGRCNQQRGDGRDYLADDELLDEPEDDEPEPHLMAWP
jgi:hypothetical protein